MMRNSLHLRGACAAELVRVAPQASSSPRFSYDAINEAAAIAHKAAYEAAIANGKSHREAMQIADRAALAKRRELNQA